MKRYISSFVIGGALLMGGAVLLAQAPGTVVFKSIQDPIPPSVVSQPFQAQQTAEFGDKIALEADTPRRAGYATVLMVTWAPHAAYPSMPASGYTHPITLNIYLDETAARAHQPIQSVSQNVVIPWRPAADPTCAVPTKWRATDGICYNGFAFPIAFDLRGLNYDFEDQFIYGIEYNTQSWGYAPIGTDGPYNSLNVGLNDAPPIAVGTDVEPDGVFWNTSTAFWYTDKGASGVGVFRPDTGWTGYVPAVEFTTFALPTTAASCKNGAWQNLVRADFSAFINQGACVAYVNMGR